ncbi:MAG: ChaN family lipoprotein [Phycisphaerales bacterium]|nr:ChaN family lipoprotein [Phycisphaerales bacterium]
MRIPLYVGMVMVCVLGPVGCESPPRAPVEASSVVVRTSLLVLDGRTGDELGWETFMSRLGDADVVVLGEQHDDATGHAVQLAVVEDMLDRSPGSGGVALEMLERDEQILVEDYRDEIIDAETFAELSSSTSWSGTGSWEAWYQPIIDAAIERDAAVIAANAPRRYVRLARTDGWERLDDLDASRKTLVDRPDTPMTGGYRDRFIELMSGHDDPDAGTDEEARAEAVELAESYFRSQQVWDATMAASVSEALRQSGPPVMLLIGRFHSDSEGGTPQQIRRLHPAAHVVTISLEPECGEVVFDEAMPQADFIVCTGESDTGI